MLLNVLYVFEAFFCASLLYVITVIDTSVLVGLIVH